MPVCGNRRRHVGACLLLTDIRERVSFVTSYLTIADILVAAYLGLVALASARVDTASAKRCCSRTAGARGQVRRVASVAENADVAKTHGRRSAADAADRGRRRPAPHVHPHYQSQAGARRTKRAATCGSVSGNVAEQGGGVGRIGAGDQVTPFDEFGRRIYEMQSTDGPLAVVQGITQITPLYTKIEGLSGGPRPIVWDMRIATSSIPRKRSARFSRHGEARRHRRPAASRAAVPAERTLSRRRRKSSEMISRTSPSEDLQQDVKQLRQLGAKLILKEIQLRAKPGSISWRAICWRNFRPRASPARRCSKSASCSINTRRTTPVAKSARRAQRRSRKDRRRQRPPTGRAFRQGDRGRGQRRRASPGWPRSSGWPMTRD